jgi:hypothetical protein
MDKQGETWAEFLTLDIGMLVYAIKVHTHTHTHTQHTHNKNTLTKNRNICTNIF